MTAVGIIANPASGEDIRPLVAQGRFVPNREKVNVLKRILAGLDAAGVDRVVMMPDSAMLGKAAVDGARFSFDVRFLDMPVFNEERDWTAWAALQAEHEELLEAMQGVLTLLNEEMGKTSVIPRTKQHLQRQVVALRITQEDHLETDEVLMVPLVRAGMDEQRQLEMVRGLLIDEAAEDPRWMIERLAEELGPEEQRLLADLEVRAG